MIITEVWNQFKALWGILDSSARLRLTGALVATVIATLMEFVGVGSIIPFIDLVGSSDLAQAKIAGKFYVWCGSPPPEVFLTWAAGGMIAMLVLSSILTYWSQIAVSHNAGAVIGEISNKLFNHYLRKSYSFHIEHSSVLLASRMGLVNQLWGMFLMPIAQIFSRVISCALILAGVMWFNPLLSFALAAFVGGTYAVVYRAVSRKVQSYGEVYVRNYNLRQKNLAEALRGIKDIKISSMERYFLDRFSSYTNNSWAALAKKHALATFPRHLIEVLAFSAVVATSVILRFTEAGQNPLSTLAVIAVVGYKLLPAGNMIYISAVALKGVMPTMHEIMPDLSRLSQEIGSAGQIVDVDLPLAGKIKIENLTYTYHGSPLPALKGVNWEIKPLEKVAIVGTSGAGKTTLLDMLLGLYSPEAGQITYGGVTLEEKTFLSWRQRVAYVPQTVFLTEDTLENNIAFGHDDADPERMAEAIRIACLQEVVLALPHGVRTMIGENGAKLSGGQRQRVGLARAFYRGCPIIVLDEATSALDGATEAELMKRIKASGRTIILVTHRLSVVEGFDKILLLKRGEVAAQGPWLELVEQSEFKRLLKGDEA